MKIRLSVLALAATGSTAFAQSSVTLSGTLDLAVRHVNNGVSSQKQLVREGANSSKLVFSGVEDIGGGLKAGFYLDSSVRADTGTASSTFWERRSTVSLLSPLGEIRLGRDGALGNSGPGDFDALNGKGVGNVMNLATPFNFSNTTTFTRVSNAVSYLTPKTLGGFYGQVQLAPSEGVAGSKYKALSLGYYKGPLETRFTYGLAGVSTVAGVNPATGVSTAAQAASGDFKYIVLGASYDFGPVRVLGSVIDWISAEAVATGAKRKQLNYNIGAMVPVGQGTVNFAYTHANRSGMGSDQQDASQFGLQYLHKLSKRTAVYVSAARLTQDALAAADTASSGGRYNMDGTTVLGRSATGFDIGLRHSF
jgi:predicted porin